MTPLDDRLTPWISQLEQQLAGDDPALRHDAVADATQHLEEARAQLGDAADDASVAALLEEFGDPAEVADSYRDAERLLASERTSPMSSVAADRAACAAAGISTAAAPSATPTPTLEELETAPYPWWGVIRDGNAWGALLYCLLALPIGIAWFTWTIAGGAVSGSLLILIIGVPLALAFLAGTRGIALLDGRIVEALLGERMPRHGRRLEGDETLTMLQRVKGWLVDRRMWTSMVYLVAMLPLGIFYFTVVVTIGASSLACIASPIILAVSGATGDYTPGLQDWLSCLLLVPAGVLGVLATLHLARGLGALHGRFAKAMLVGGEGEASRRNPVHPDVAFRRGGILLLGAALLAGITFGVNAALYEGRSETRTVNLDASDVTTLELDLDATDIEIVEDPSLDPGDVRATARIDGIFGERDADGSVTVELAQDGTRATLRAACGGSHVIWWHGCEIDIAVRVAPNSGIDLTGRLDVGELDIDADFASVDVETDVADIDATIDAEQVRLGTDVGDIELRLGSSADAVMLRSDVGDIDVATDDTWNLTTTSDVGDRDVRIDTSDSARRTMTITTDVGDIEVHDLRSDIDDGDD